MKIIRKRVSSDQVITREATPEERTSLTSKGWCWIVREWADGTTVKCGGAPVDEYDGRCETHRDGAVERVVERDEEDPDATNARPDDPDAGVRKIMAEKAAARAENIKAGRVKAAATRAARRTE